MDTQQTQEDRAATLFGGITMEVLLLDGAKQSVKARQITILEYEQAIPLLDDEIALTAFATALLANDGSVAAKGTKAWAGTLHPESYEALQAAVQKVNATGFFAFAARQRERERSQQQANIAALATLPGDVVKSVMEAGMKSASPSGLPKPRPR